MWLQKPVYLEKSFLSSNENRYLWQTIVVFQPGFPEGWHYQVYDHGRISLYRIDYTEFVSNKMESKILKETRAQ